MALCFSAQFQADRASPVQVFSSSGLEVGEERRGHARVDAGQFGGVGAKVVEFQLARRLGGRLERSWASSLGRSGSTRGPRARVGSYVDPGSRTRDQERDQEKNDVYEDGQSHAEHYPEQAPPRRASSATPAEHDDQEVYHPHV
jgi:hypothetical protein